MENTAVTIRKGPWTSEEDEILMGYVKMNGPRDWSNIRSNGLLPRTGKSCRLRWVNKLKPNLKSGCKFSADEERMVIDLQARFGNKWARIATHLPGRTDNDVKNFWSTRQKRLARLLQTPLPIRSQRRQGKAPISNEVPKFEQPNVSSDTLLIPYAEEYLNGECSFAPYIQDNSVKVEAMLNMDAATNLLEPAVNDGELFLQSDGRPRPLLDDLPLLLDDRDLMPELFDMDFSFPTHFSFEGSREMELPVTPRLFDPGVGDHGIGIEDPGSPESYFGEFPVDMFDYLDQPPPS